MPTACTAIHCVIVDDHQMLLEMRAESVGELPGLDVTVTATDVTEADRLAGSTAHRRSR